MTQYRYIVFKTISEKLTDKFSEMQKKLSSLDREFDRSNELPCFDGPNEEVNIRNTIQEDLSKLNDTSMEIGMGPIVTTPIFDLSQLVIAMTCVYFLCLPILTEKSIVSSLRKHQRKISDDRLIMMDVGKLVVDVVFPDTKDYSCPHFSSAKKEWMNSTDGINLISTIQKNLGELFDSQISEIP